MNALFAQGFDKLERLGRNLAVLVKQSTVHVRSDKFDHANRAS